MKEISKDTLGDRMKGYEANAVLNDGALSNTPVVIRLDGNSFHTWTRKMHLKRPFDMAFITAIQETLLHLCQTIPSCVFGYCQSDEISLCLRNDTSDRSEPWFDNRIQKLCSISASMATARFNQYISQHFYEPLEAKELTEEQKAELKSQLDKAILIPDYSIITSEPPFGEESDGRQVDHIPLAYFDSRVMFMPSLEEVVNCFIWRQNDCIRNSVSSVAQAHFSSRQLKGKNSDEQKAMLREIGMDWDALPSQLRYGSLCMRVPEVGEYNGTQFVRGRFKILTETPRIVLERDVLTQAYHWAENRPKDPPVA